MNAAAQDSREPVTHAPGDTGTILIVENGAPVQKQWRWGLHPIEPGGRPLTLLRWEARPIDRPCLIVVNDFGLRVGGTMKYRASLITDAPFFCLAGVWRPATDDWPESYAALTTEAYPDIAPFKDRHVAVVRQEDWPDWLQLRRPVSELLRPFPSGSFKVVAAGRPGRARDKAATRDLFDFG